MGRLVMAAGGGGDAVAAAMLSAALYEDEPTVISTYAWDRLIVDPVPGPRRPANFTGLRSLTAGVHAVPGTAEAVAPAGSTLPRLAEALSRHTFALVDPYDGAQGMARQLREIIEHLDPASVDLLDVGGDILARGDEPTLRSPLADALSLATCAQLDAPIRLLLAGPGLDGEVPADDLRDLLGPVVHTFTAENVEAVSAVLDWHPSEVTAMLAATARGARGLCETGDSGLPVPLTDEGPNVHRVDMDEALDRSRLARAIVETTSLEEAEQRSREICGYSEIDYARSKAAGIRDQPKVPLEQAAVLGRLDQFETQARTRGITHTTFRRVTEALGLSGYQRTEVRDLLINARPDQYAAPLWRISAEA